jgi:hypothetical protein
LRRHGEINPERSTDKMICATSTMSSDVALLGFAYYCSDDPRYAAHAAKLLRAWFLDPASRRMAFRVA